MNVAEFRQALADHPGCTLRLTLDGGRAIADHFHITEVGRVEKQFIDCGGVRRSSVACVLQTLVAHDTDHRLLSDKLANIVALADSLDIPPDAPIEVEHQERSVSVDGIGHCAVIDGVLEFHLVPKQTACLAEDACGIGDTPCTTSLNILGSTDDCCGSTGCC